jgi:hypothetical protein
MSWSSLEQGDYLFPLGERRIIHPKYVFNKPFLKDNRNYSPV